MARHRQSVETRTKVLHTAARLFAQNGYRATTLDMIATEVRATQGAVYFHFSSKRELAREVIRLQREQLAEISAPYFTERTDGIAKIIDLNVAMARGIGESAIVRAGLRLVSESGDELLPHRDLAQYAAWVDATRGLLASAEKRGELRPGLELSATAETVTMLFRGALDASNFMAVEPNFITRLKRAWSVLLPGLVSDSHAAEMPELLERFR